MATAIEFDHVGKQYRLGLVSTGTLSHDLNRWWQTAILRKEDPYLKIGSVNDRTQKADSEYVWALRDIDFKVEQGDVVGIIGKNGAGKSTLLKLLSKVTAPTVGTIRARGRIASLLEVGTGFHGEMTGRENIYLNGAILGMTKEEINRKLDEIVDFSGCERYLDTPVKRYSSGMTVRLGFAVAAFLDPEILVVDEVLAVGDAEFQKKAIGKMQDVSRGEGRTVLFVSHNMASIKSLCKSGVVLHNGCVEKIGTAEDCVDFYLSSNISEFANYVEINQSHRVEGPMRELEYISVRMFNDVQNMSTEETMEFEMVVKRNNMSIKKCQFGIVVRDSSDTPIGATYSTPVQLPDGAETIHVLLSVPNHQLTKGRYYLNFNIADFDFLSDGIDYDIVSKVISFDVKYVDAAHKHPFVVWPGIGNCSFGGTKAVVDFAHN
jgi:lipopolysaccharide transport system ATP-binding protein